MFNLLATSTVNLHVFALDQRNENTAFGMFMQDREDVGGFYGVYTSETYFWMTETINAFQFSGFYWWCPW